MPKFLVRTMSLQADRTIEAKRFEVIHGALVFFSDNADPDNESPGDTLDYPCDAIAPGQWIWITTQADFH